MSMKLYYNDMSAPCRAVLMTARALNLQLDLQEINTYSKEISQDLLKINPQHTVPTLVDEDFIISDCHAIACYLVSKTDGTSSLYPKEPKARALVDQRLFFDSGTLYPRVNTIINAIIIEDEKQIATSRISAITETYRLLDQFLANKKFLSGDCLTIADICCVCSVSTATIMTPISTEKYPNLSSWYRNFKTLPYYEETNGIGLNRLDALVELKLGRPRTKELCE